MTKERYKKAMITGASSGLGQEYASSWLKPAPILILVARRTGASGVFKLPVLRASAGVEAEVLVADLSLDEEIEKVALKIRQSA